MKLTTNLAIVFLLAFAMAAPAAIAKPAAVLLQEALYAEEVEGDLDAATKIYQQVIADDSAQRSHKAQAMYRLGNCYLKRKDEQQAKAIFEKLVVQYKDQTQIIEKVKPLLEELVNADPAALMPPDTIVYVEIGTPGRQIETILNMLKGTPFENPLAAVGGREQGQKPSGEKGPSDIVGALFNPSMMAEFKKIRGMAIGVTEIAQNNPPMIAVLYPGKSDALRGLILAGLGMVGRQSQPIEGMQTLRIEDAAGVAYDDNVVIIAQPPERLNWCVKQYKGVIQEPTLASNNNSFAKVGKKARQENALTIWAKVDRVYGGIFKQFPPDQVPVQMRIADGLADFKNIDDMIVQFSIEQQGLAFETNIAFKDGHHCRAYDLIRTPNLTKAGLEAVPSEAIALISFALGEAETARAKAASEKIRNITGLDIGREIFANIEQVTLFAVPPAKVGQSNAALPPIASCLGLAVTSHNPQQTRQILTSLLATTNLIAGDKQAGQADSPAGKYQIGLANNQQLYCYLDQTSKTTVLSLNPAIVESSLAAVKSRKGVYQSGALKAAVDRLSATTSKLALINVGGAIRVAAANMNLLADPNNQNVQQIVSQLAQACDKTIVQFCTSEELNNFGVRVSVSGLPPTNQVLGPIMQLSQAIGQAKARAAAEKRKAVAPADIAKASQAPVIDGQAEDLWSNARKYELKNVMYSPLSGPGDCSANYKAMWDSDNLYLLVEVTDDSLKNDGGDFYNNDAIEIFIDSDNSKSASYGDNDFQYTLVWDKDKPIMMEDRHQATQGVQFAMTTTQTGYCGEIKLPWSTLKGKPSAGMRIGLDVHVNDDDDGGDRDSKLTWHGREDNAWMDPRALGNAQLLGLVGWWKLDESEGATAADSSGNGHNGTLQGNPRWQPSAGKLAGALEFDGVDDYVDTGYASDLPTWTVAAWVKSPAAPSGAAACGPVHRQMNYQINWNHQVDAFRGAAGVFVDGVWYAASFGDLQADTWYHLAATYDGENLKAYKNGVLATDNTEPSGMPYGEGETLKLGRHSIDESYFGGTIDDVRIYNYALGPVDIAALASGR